MVVVALIGTAFTFVSLNDFKLAKTCFLIAAADAWGGIAMWGLRSERPTWQILAVVFVGVGAIGVFLVLALRYVGEKKGLKVTSSGKLLCDVMAVQLEPVYRFFQEPPVYFQRLDTTLRISLTNQTGKPLYIKDQSVEALVGTEWIKFKNADRAAFEPYAFGIMTPLGEGNPLIRRFDLSRNGFDFVMQRKPIGVDENMELWMFFISGIAPKDLANVSQFRFVFYDSAKKEFPCVSPYSIKDDKGTVIGTSAGDLTALAAEPVPTNLREEPAH